MIVKNLYHGSGYLHKELKPGYLHSGVEVRWDETESNRFLYATTIKNSAIELGFASAVEKAYSLERFQSDDDKFILTFEDNHPPKLSDLMRLNLFVYEIKFNIRSGWQKVNNKTNNMDEEYKTSKIITAADIATIEKVDLDKWLENKQIAIVSTKPGKPGFEKW